MSEPYAAAALRHSKDSDLLADSGRFQGAGYLIGLAVECAIKSAISETRPAAEAPQMHLPKLVEGAKRTLNGRNAHRLFSVLQMTDFMKSWSIDIRYARDGLVDEAQFRRWRKDANRALAAANLRQQA